MISKISFFVFNIGSLVRFWWLTNCEKLLKSLLLIGFAILSGHAQRPLQTFRQGRGCSVNKSMNKTSKTVDASKYIFRNYFHVYLFSEWEQLAFVTWLNFAFMIFPICGLVGLFFGQPSWLKVNLVFCWVESFLGLFGYILFYILGYYWLDSIMLFLVLPAVFVSLFWKLLSQWLTDLKNF